MDNYIHIVRYAHINTYIHLHIYIYYNARINFYQIHKLVFEFLGTYLIPLNFLAFSARMWPSRPSFLRLTIKK